MGGFLTSRRQQAQAPLESLDMSGVAKHMQTNVQNVVVMAGAGISTSAGIPDFRSPGSGLYDNLQKYGLPRAEAIFEISYFKRNPAPFYDLARELWPGQYSPTLSHWFLRLLHEKGLLTRVYTQNIDSLETAAGVPTGKIVAAHGNFDSCHVVGNPGREVATAELHKALEEGEAGWRRLEEQYGGLVKPSIVFFGEALPERFFRLRQSDFRKCDLLIVMGTSLKVQPFADLVNWPTDTCPRLLLNREEAGSSFRFNKPSNERDVFVSSDCDAGVLELCQHLGWEAELRALVSSAGCVQVHHGTPEDSALAAATAAAAAGM